MHELQSTLNHTVFKPDVFCWRLTVCQLKKNFCFHHVQIVGRQSCFYSFHLSLTRPKATDCDFILMVAVRFIPPCSIKSSFLYHWMSPKLLLCLLWWFFLLVLILHPHVEKISNRSVYWVTLLSTPKSAPKHCHWLASSIDSLSALETGCCCKFAVKQQGHEIISNTEKENQSHLVSLLMWYCKNCHLLHFK